MDVADYIYQLVRFVKEISNRSIVYANSIGNEKGIRAEFIVYGDEFYIVIAGSCKFKTWCIELTRGFWFNIPNVSLDFGRKDVQNKKGKTVCRVVVWKTDIQLQNSFAKTY